MYVTAVTAHEQNNVNFIFLNRREVARKTATHLSFTIFVSFTLNSALLSVRYRRVVRLVWKFITAHFTQTLTTQSGVLLFVAAFHGTREKLIMYD